MKFTGKLKLMAAPFACAGGVLLGGCCTDPSTEAFKLPPQVELLPGAKFENDPMRAQWAFLPIDDEISIASPNFWPRDMEVGSRLLFEYVRLKLYPLKQSLFAFSLFSF